MNKLSAKDIINLRPNDLRTALTKRMASDAQLADTISKLLGYTPRWYKLSCIEFTQVALAWASLETKLAYTKISMQGLIQELETIKVMENRNDNR